MNTIGISTPNAAGLVGEAAIEGGSRPQGEIHAGKTGILGTDSLKVVEMGDVNQLVETLKAETDERRRDMTRSRLEGALSVILSGSLVDGKDKDILEEIEKASGEIDGLTGDLSDLEKLAEGLKGQISGIDVKLVELAAKIEATKAAIERIRKTPEDQRTEQQKKELEKLEAEQSDLEKTRNDLNTQKADLNTQLTDAQQKADDCRQAIAALNAAISSLLAQMSQGVRSALAEAVKLGPDRSEFKAGPKDKPKDPNEKDAIDQLAALLAGDSLADVIAGKSLIRA